MRLFVSWWSREVSTAWNGLGNSSASSTCSWWLLWSIPVVVVMTSPSDSNASSVCLTALCPPTPPLTKSFTRWPVVTSARKEVSRRRCARWLPLWCQPPEECGRLSKLRYWSRDIIKYKQLPQIEEQGLNNSEVMCSAECKYLIIMWHVW